MVSGGIARNEFTLNEKVSNGSLFAANTFSITLLLIGALTGNSVLAQEELIPLQRPGDERPNLLEEKPFKPKPIPGLKLPPVVEPDSKETQLSKKLTIDVKEFNFSGNLAFTNEQLNEVVSTYLGKKASTFDLQAIKNAITRHYIQYGYINSGATIPDQDIASGILTINIVEGELTEVKAVSSGRLNNNYVSDRIRLDPHKPFSLNVLQERLYLLQLDPRIDRIKANLTPGLERGQSILDINVTEAKPYQLLFQIDNHRLPSIGEEQASLLFEHLNVTGAGDKLNVDFRYTEGLNNGYIRYDYPISADDKKIYASYDINDSLVIDDAFKDAGIDIENESSTSSIGIALPFFRSSSESFELSVQLDKRKSESMLDGSPLPIAGSGAENDGTSHVTALRLIQSWFKQSQNQVVSLRHMLSIGLDALDSTQHDADFDPSGFATPDSDFTAWLFQLQLANQYPLTGIQTIFRSDLQVAFDNLMPMEQFAMGGANTVRGYRENQLVRDNGFLASAEIRKRIFQNSSGKQQIQLVGFLDYGRAWSEQSSIGSDNLFSVGAGLKWDWNNTASAELFWAHPIEDVDNPNDSLQDDGIHFKIMATIL